MVIVRVAQQQQAACVFRAGLHQSLELSTNLCKVSQCLEKIISRINSRMLTKPQTTGPNSHPHVSLAYCLDRFFIVKALVVNFN